ncbi:MAG: MaoC family dehydratase [Candidatus Dormibacteraceae bacterium]
MLRVEGVEALSALTGSELGVSSWHLVTQEQVDLFADATGDHQWIHVDRERAGQGPFGGTIAHGYLTLSLLPALLHEVLSVGGVRMGVNYGLNRVRFPAPVPVGSRLRAVARLQEATPIPGGVQVVLGVAVQLESGAKPACVAEAVYRYLM